MSGFSISPLLTQGSSFPDSSALWIWAQEYNRHESNSYFCFRKEIQRPASGASPTVLHITADSRYTLFINGVEVGAGPVRGYVDAWFYDSYPCDSYLKEGSNLIEIRVMHYGISNLQYIQAQPGLLVSLMQGEVVCVASDTTWEACRLDEYAQNVVRSCCQLGFEEHVNLSRVDRQWSPAVVVANQSTHEHKRLIARDIPFLGGHSRAITRLISASRVQSLADRKFTFTLRRLWSSEPRGANLVGYAGLLVTQVVISERWEGNLYAIGLHHSVSVNGKPIDFQRDQDLLYAKVALDPGRHLLCLAFCTGYDHALDFAIGFSDPGEALRLYCPKDGNEASPWLATPALWKTGALGHCQIQDAQFTPDAGARFDEHERTLKALVSSAAGCSSVDAMEACLGHRLLPLAREFIVEADAYFDLRTECPILPLPLPERVEAELAVPPGSVRLIFDLEDMTNGFPQIAFSADGPVTVDLFAFEAIVTDSAGMGMEPRVQYMAPSFSYRFMTRLISEGGAVDFKSTSRRGFRYLGVTFRSTTGATLKRLSVKESTYQPRQIATFRSSDARLNEIFRVGQRTLLLCMEDTLTDCPSYEQVFWTGDARNEALFAAYTFGAYDLVERGQRLVAHSLQRLPLAASQCPSGWDVIIPSFSFLSVLTAWEGYWNSGNLTFLAEQYPALRKNLTNGVSLCNGEGLFNAEAWNFLDWAEFEVEKGSSFLPNSILLAGALQSGVKIAQALGEPDDASLFKQYAERIKTAIARRWNPLKRAFPDSVLPNGTPSERHSLHTTILALMFDLLDGEDRASAVASLSRERSDLTPLGSPNTYFYLMEVLEKQGTPPEQLLSRVESFWGGMIDAGALTFWETLNFAGSEFITRSHCHGWSAGPVYLLPRVIFGIRQLEAGWRKIQLTPDPVGLDWVEATVCTPLGMLELTLKRSASGGHQFHYQAPDGMEVCVTPLSSGQPLLASCRSLQHSFPTTYHATSKLTP